MPSLLDRALNVGESKKFKEYQRRVSPIVPWFPRKHETAPQ